MNDEVLNEHFLSQMFRQLFADIFLHCYRMTEVQNIEHPFLTGWEQSPKRDIISRLGFYRV